MPGPPLNFRSPLNLEKISGDPQNFRPEIFRRPLKIGGGLLPCLCTFNFYNHSHIHVFKHIILCFSSFLITLAKLRKHSYERNLWII